MKWGVNGVLRWTARVLSLFTIGFVLLTALGGAVSYYELHPAVISYREVGCFVVLPLGIGAGLLLAWRWEGVGGAITIGSLIGFCFARRLMSVPLPWVAYVVFGVPGLLFLAVWLSTHRRRRDLE